ncbi:hypothetical protein [Pseudomonas entomophila]|uniref:hypothetical protein n=1 Tax=Pseudomonas entomophila TaxID=312306 RepID=UPI001EFF8E9F|nr:hypothetical protein [Pseudomonas entomophila]MCG8291426.1 hypothetical protein [Pseudomonas entomophila]
MINQEKGSFMSKFSQFVECTLEALAQMRETFSFASTRRDALLARLGDFNSTWNSLSLEQKHEYVSHLKGLQRVRQYDQAVYLYCLNHGAGKPGQVNYHALRHGLSVREAGMARVRAVDAYVTKVADTILLR